MTEYRDRWVRRVDRRKFYADWSEDQGYDDGWPHERDEDGWCLNCNAPPNCSHTRLVPREDA